MSRKTALDIESLGNPENSGYAVVVPNFAFVAIPDAPETDHLEYLYVQQPVQDQLDLGLRVGASTMDFWHNKCAKEFPGAHEEMIKSFTLVNPVIHTNVPYICPTVHYIPHVIQQFVYGTSHGVDNDVSTEVYGNGCHFDCSILQENSRVLFGNADLWHYSSPQNARTLKGRLNDEQRAEMDDIVQRVLGAFVRNMNGTVGVLELHHPLYDAAREALQISYCLKILDQK